MQPLSFDQLHALPTAVDLITATRTLGIGQTKAYQLAKDGELVCRIIKIGNSYHAPTAELLKLLGVTNRKQLGPALPVETEQRD